MGAKHADPNGNFTDLEVATCQLLFDMLMTRECAPVVMFALNDSGIPCAMFNPEFSAADADSIAALIISQLEVIQENAPM